MEIMDRRGFFARTLLMIFSAVAAWFGHGGRTGETRELEVGRTSRKRADHWRGLAG